MWLSVDGGGLLLYDGTTVKQFKKEDGLCSNNVTAVLEDSKGDIWISCIKSSSPKETNDGGLCKYDGQKFSSFGHIPGLINNDIYTIFEDSRSCIWIGVVGMGVYRYMDDDFKLIQQTDRMDLTSRMGLQHILEDSKGALWFGFSGGLFRWRDDKIINVNKNGPWDFKE